ncbi:hypothetical protein [Paracandidimonas soli]|jgi:ABC-type cobalamin/Fe3+-siderophores transport system ATPase subunit|uniref:Uncharacterized protein n=1 Tax=Paracandidimonas soli TaxID=1917182 RepID=A0A4R3ULC7_9BURK|nr:hypothetical protein [Paracandidimonas soli]TCU91632.1 hypothetical protein EV686_11728 [Paracandidimonas soli]
MSDEPISMLDLKRKIDVLNGRAWAMHVSLLSVISTLGEPQKRQAAEIVELLAKEPHIKDASEETVKAAKDLVAEVVTNLRGSEGPTSNS